MEPSKNKLQPSDMPVKTKVGGTRVVSLDDFTDTGLEEKITGIMATVGSTTSTKQPTTFPVGKLDAHLENIPHMAISIFVFYHHKLLLQQRAATKYHSGGLWANTVCSHPRWQETVSDCAQRRLQEELGFSIPLKPGARINYEARVGELFENEHVQCFYGKLENDDTIDINSLSKRFNRSEVSALQWMSLDEIDESLKKTPQRFSEWFKIYMQRHRSKLESMMDKAAILG